MITLAIDTTSGTASCALTRDGRLLGVSTVDGILTHSETMLPMIEQMLKNLSLTVGDVDIFAVTEGPGSFTGVRIGVATMKGLAFGSGKPCVGVSTLEALAENLEGFDGLIVPVMDARRQQVYTSIFSAGERLMPDSLLPLSELCAELLKYELPIYLVGDGYDLAARFISSDERLAGRLRTTPAALRPHSAVSAALLAGEKFASGEYVSDRELRPLYLRDSQAERERKERESK